MITDVRTRTSSAITPSVPPTNGGRLRARHLELLTPLDCARRCRYLPGGMDVRKINRIPDWRYSRFFEPRATLATLCLELFREQTD